MTLTPEQIDAMHPAMLVFPDFLRVLAFGFFTGLDNDSNRLGVDGLPLVWGKFSGYNEDHYPTTFPVCPLGAVLRMFGARNEQLFPTYGIVVLDRLRELCPALALPEDYDVIAGDFIQQWDNLATHVNETRDDGFARLAALMGVPNSRA